MNAAVEELSQAQRERLAFLEMRAYFTGELRRADIEARFGIKPAASSRDLSAYRDLEPGNLDYDVAARCYRPSKAFKSIFEFSSERVLAWLLQGFGDGLELKLRKAAPCEGPGNLVRPDLAVLSTVTRAMCGKRAIKVSYLSLSSGASSRELVPVALADNGLRWHVRAFDRANARFGDFVLTRIAKAKEIDGPVAENELLPADEQWARIVDMEVVPHPGVRWAQAVEADRVMGLEGGGDDYVVKPFEPRELVARVRSILRRRGGGASVAGALQRRYARFGDWTLDCAANTLRGQDDGEQVLGTAEAQVLRTFLERPNQILTREQLMGTRDLSPMDRSIDVRISRLRRRLESDPHNPRMIKTVYGAGYMFCAVVSWS